MVMCDTHPLVAHLDALLLLLSQADKTTRDPVQDLVDKLLDQRRAISHG